MVSEGTGKVERRPAVKCTSGNMHGVEGPHDGGRVKMEGYRSVAVVM